MLYSAAAGSEAKQRRGNEKKPLKHGIVLLHFYTAAIVLALPTTTHIKAIIFYTHFRRLGPEYCSVHSADIEHTTTFSSPPSWQSFKDIMQK